MNIQTFRASSLQEALQQVRKTLGPDASVVHTREVQQSVMGLFGKKTLVEVEASLDVAVASRFGLPGPKAKEATRSPANDGVTESSWPSSQKVSGDVQQAIGSEKSGALERAAPQSQRNEQLAQTTAPQQEESDSLSPAMLETMTDLIDGGIPTHLAPQLVREACGGLSSSDQNDSWLVKGQISRVVTNKVSASGSLEIQPGEQKVAALVGPTGVGKTTTLAKIAAGFRFDLGLDIGLITLDTFRLGAVDQLLQYAELIAAPLEVVSSPEEITGALQRLRECDLVLIDTAGRSPKDTEQLAVLTEFLSAAQPDSTHLVLSAANSVGHAEETVNRFLRLKPTNLAITKMDESVGFGAWLPLLQQTQLPVSYVTNGQHVPDDITVASPRRLANMLLGQFSHHGPAIR